MAAGNSLGEGKSRGRERSSPEGIIGRGRRERQPPQRWQGERLLDPGEMHKQGAAFGSAAPMELANLGQKRGGGKKIEIRGT